MTAAEAVAGILLLIITIYACTGLADYGVGFWDLTAGGRERGARARELIDAAITPVWEANHVWLIFLLILTWTAFGPAFASITTTLYLPLALAMLGIVLRAAGFAIRKDAARAGARHVAGRLFGIGSVLTPFFLGAAIGGLLTGRVPEGNATGDELTSWLNPTSMATGLLVLSAGVFLSAVYLVAEARRRGAPDLQGYFRVRAIAAGVAGLVAGAAALGALLADQRTMFDRVIGRGWPLLLLGVLTLAATVWLAARGVVRGLRLVAAAGIAALTGAWGVAQYPYLLPFSLTISDAAGAPLTLRWVLGCSLVAALTVGPALTLLFVLDQRDRMGEDPVTSREQAARTHG